MSLADLTIEDVQVHPVALPSVRTFMVAGGGVATAGQPSVRVLVRVTGSDGTIGWGEATPIPAWTYETAESIVTTVAHYLAPVTVGHAAWDLDGLASRFDRAINRGFTIGAPLAKSAVDLAVHDLVGKHLGVSVGELWGQRRQDKVELAWVVAGQTPGEVGDAIAEGRELGHRSFKVKIGLGDMRRDIDVVRAVRDAAPEAYLWVDANQGYHLDEAIQVSDAMAELGVAAFEQPLPANDVRGLTRLTEATRVPVALDESLRHPSDLSTFLQVGPVDVAIAKVQRSGGLALSRRLCALAEDSGVRLMGSGLTDSDLGLAASIHLFAAFGIDTPVDLNGRQFLDSAYVGETTVRVEDGHAWVPTGPGLGVDVDEQAVDQLRDERLAALASTD